MVVVVIVMQMVEVAVDSTSSWSSSKGSCDITATVMVVVIIAMQMVEVLVVAPAVLRAAVN